MNEFAKIIIASDGEQVLIYKVRDDEECPALCVHTRVNGDDEAAMTFSYEDTEQRDLEFSKFGVEKADGIRGLTRGAFASEPEQAK